MLRGKMTLIQLLSLLFLLVAVYADTEPTPCDDTSVVVVYDWPESDYTMSMTAKDYYGSCGPFATTDLKKMLLGSGKMWNSTCTKVIPHTLVIEPTVECRGDQWRVQFVAFKLDAAKMVEVYVDDEKVISELTNPYFELSKTIHQPGKSVRIVVYPKWRLDSIVFYDVVIDVCCIPMTTITTTTTTTTTATSHKPTPDCAPACSDLTAEDLPAKNGERCFFTDYVKPRKWACTGSCFGKIAVSQIGTFQFGSIRDVPKTPVVSQCECCKAVSGRWEQSYVKCARYGRVIETRPLAIYVIDQCECLPCEKNIPTTTTLRPYGVAPPYGGDGVPPYGVPPSHGYWQKPKYMMWYNFNPNEEDNQYGTGP